jgi:hypothetical protein
VIRWLSLPTTWAHIFCKVTLINPPPPRRIGLNRYLPAHLLLPLRCLSISSPMTFRACSQSQHEIKATVKMRGHGHGQHGVTVTVNKRSESRSRWGVTVTVNKRSESRSRWGVTVTITRADKITAMWIKTNVNHYKAYRRRHTCIHKYIHTYIHTCINHVGISYLFKERHSPGARSDNSIPMTSSL